MHTSLLDRVLSALVSLLIVAGGLAALVAGLAARMTPPEQRAALVAVLSLREPPETPSPRPSAEPSPSRSTPGGSRASPANLRNRATPIVAPSPPLPPLIVPPPVITAPRAGTGFAASSGASDRPGPGQGAGGEGDGTGGGGSGSGTGTGAGDGAGGYGDAVTRPRQIRGRLHFSDLPPDLRESKTGGELELQYRIGIDGRVSDCRIRLSSGRPELDATTCRLITERFRFRPSRDARGNPVSSIMIETHGWYHHPEGE